MPVGEKNQNRSASKAKAVHARVGSTITNNNDEGGDDGKGDDNIPPKKHNNTNIK